MIKVRFLINITAPREQAGNAGDIKDLDDYTAWMLLKDGYAVRVENEKPKTNRSKNDAVES